MLDKEDFSKIEKMIFSNVVEALEQVVLPKFLQIDNRMDSFEGRMDGLENRMGGLENRLGGLEHKMDGLEKAVEILDDNMSGVKMRLAVVENKLETLIDTTIVAKDHEKRIQRLEKAVL